MKRLVPDAYSRCREMKRNKIKIVDSLTFKGMDSLRSLKMQRNGITKLMDGAFFGLNNIEELWGDTLYSPFNTLKDSTLHIV